MSSRRIGPIGTAARLLVGAGLLYLALFAGTSWRLSWYDAALGLALFPGVMLAFALAAGARGHGPVRQTGSLAVCLNCLVIVGLLSNPYTRGGAELFYGTTLFIAAWRGQPGCEATVISNWLLRRNDQVGCPVFSPIDRAEARRHAPRRTRADTPPLR